MFNKSNHFVFMMCTSSRNVSVGASIHAICILSIPKKSFRLSQMFVNNFSLFIIKASLYHNISCGISLFIIQTHFTKIIQLNDWSDSMNILGIPVGVNQILFCLFAKKFEISFFVCMLVFELISVLSPNHQTEI
ncbi:MAG: hypothetical protein WCG25_08250 [bacterium]